MNSFLFINSFGEIMIFSHFNSASFFICRFLFTSFEGLHILVFLSFCSFFLYYFIRNVNQKTGLINHATRKIWLFWIQIAYRSIYSATFSIESSKYFFSWSFKSSMIIFYEKKISSQYADFFLRWVANSSCLIRNF